ncbi:GIY-YIG nuclease family protein [Kitasatospora sp. NBC_01300]|uniref:GIY-YIG nuclease family protein n=1 Tax=Kitasatospora sp. NBC_01300 TaxID=2903574 RepID=UPI00352D29D2|nr:GIY-YIG nuclease family protein [Kitasatospora sp. NBC_01300]
MSESQYAARLVEYEIDPEVLSGHPFEEQARAVLLEKLRADGVDRESDEVVDLVRLVEWLALWRLGPAAERPRIPGRGQLYVLSFAGATSSFVKVGRTADFSVRLRQHRAKAERDGKVLLDAWTSEPVADAHPWEQGVLRELRRRHSGESKGECFYGLDYGEARSVADQQRIRLTPRSVGLPTGERLYGRVQSVS